MGYLQQTLVALRNNCNGPPPPWDERHRDAWLIAMPDDFAVQRGAMVAALRDRLRALHDRISPAAIERALFAMATVPRERFVCPLGDDLAYLPASIDIGHNQTMSHPEMVAVLSAAADPRGGRVLDVGTGSGYQAAVLSRMAHGVTSIEAIPALARLAGLRLARHGFANVCVAAGDALAQNWVPESYDSIVVAAGAAKVPDALLAALKPEGRLVMPIGATQDQEHLVLVRKAARGAVVMTIVCPARFVPLTGTGARRITA